MASCIKRTSPGSRLAFAGKFAVFLVPFVSKFIEFAERSADFLHPFGEAVGHCGRDRRFVVAVDKSLLFQVP